MITQAFRPSRGGAETYVDDLCEYLRRHGYFVYVLTYQPITMKIRGESVEKRSNLEVRRFSWIGGNLFHKFEKYPPMINFLYVTPYLLLRSLLFMLKHKNEVDVIHAQGLCTAFIAAFLKRIFKTKSVVSILAIHNFEEGTFFSNVVARIFSSLDKVLVEAEVSKREVVAIGVPESRVAIFMHWVDLNRFRPRDKKVCRAKLGLDAEFLVLFVGRAIPIKGAGTLLEVAKKVDKRIHFAFVSDAGPQVGLLREAARTEKNVIFVGGVDYENLHWYYDAADVFVMPSQYEEDVAKVVLEAISCGTPVIATNRGAIPSIVDPSVAIVLNPGVAEIKEAVEFLFYNRGELERLTSNCRPYALKRFSYDNIRVIMSSYDE